jgi:hypothetical protein
MNPSVFVPLTLLAIGAGVFLLLRWLSRGGAEIAAEHAARLQRATQTRATVRAIERSQALRKRGTVAVKVRLRVEGPEARETVGIWEVDLVHIPAIQPDKVLDVRVDADDPGRCYPAFAGATHSHLFGSMWLEAGDR